MKKPQQQLTIGEIIHRALSHRAQRLSLEEMTDPKHGLKVAVWDIEATGLKADIDPMLCASIKPLDGGKVTTFRIDDSEGYEKRRWDDSELCCHVRDELEKYNVLIHHFGDLYDIPFLNTRLVGWNCRPVAIQRMVFVDTWRLSRSRLLMRNNRLNTLIEYLDTSTQKTSVHGRWWSRAMTGDKKGIDWVVKHNIADVKALEEVTLRLGKFVTFPYRSYK